MQNQTIPGGTQTFRDRYSWPLGIMIGLGLFMAMTVYFVKKAFSERVDLVATDYYYRDKSFSERLLRQKKLLKHGPSEITRSAAGVSVLLPGFFTDKKITGTVYFYSPLNPADDFSLPVEFQGKNAAIPAKVAPGHRWRVSLEFSAGGDGYYLESVI